MCGKLIPKVFVFYFLNENVYLVKVFITVYDLNIVIEIIIT